jgi:Ca2+-transporting ATPase
MITGDHPLTARAIAADLGIGDGGRTLTGPELEHLDDAALDDAVRDVSVFARVSPEHKLRIVCALQQQGHVVAMTGDGVNDAPALKRADIGVAMGITGTDVSKEAADMVLRDDNFATIVAAVEEGRVIYDNLRRFVGFAVAGNLGKIIVMLGWPIPYLISGGEVDAAVALLPLQLLWLNLMTDGLLGLSMGVEPAERGVMRRHPHRPGSSLWAGGLGRQTAWVGVVIGAAALAVGFAYHESGRAEWQTMIFTSLALLQVFQALGTRSSVDSLRTIGLRSNPVMLAIASLVVALQLAAVYTPLNEFLDLEPLGVVDLAICFGLGIGLLALIEAAKVRRRASAG